MYMKNIFSRLARVTFAMAFVVAVVFSFTRNVHASDGGLISAVITGPNQITITYDQVVDNNVMSSYSNLGMGLLGRNITSASDNVGTNHIILSFDGPPAALNATGTIDIDNTVTYVGGGNFPGQTAVPVTDGQSPSLGAVTLQDLDNSGALTAGDTLSFLFDEPMDTTTITTSNLDTQLGLSNGHTFGTVAHGLAIAWNTSQTILTVTVGSDMTIVAGDTVSAASSVVDLAGNPNVTPAPILLPINSVTPRTLYYNNVDNNEDWGDLGNWWTDSALTVPATSLPTAYDNVVISGVILGDSNNVPMEYVNSMVVTGGTDSGNDGPFGGYNFIVVPVSASHGATFNQYTGLVGYLLADTTFNDSSFAGAPFLDNSGPSFGYAMIVGTVQFTTTTANYGTIIGDATFNGSYGNAGLIYGTATFNDATSNPGVVVGHAIFHDNSLNGGFSTGGNPNIIGNADVYYPSDNPIDGTVTGTVTYHGYNAPFAGGTGTQNDPYIIQTCDQLQQIPYDLTAHYKLEGPGGIIDCSSSGTWNPDASEWEDGTIGSTLIPDSYASVTHTNIIVANNGYFGFQPIGDDNTPFTGTLNGNGNTITDLWIFRKNTPYNGLFGETNGATISNLTLSNANIVGGEYTGGVVGSMIDGSATGITLSNDMVRAYLNYYGGGFAGQMSGAAALSGIENTGGSVHGSGDVIGGLVGKMVSGTLDSSSASATVDGGLSIGGLIGEMDGGTVTNSSATGDITSNRSEYVQMKTGYNAGGFVGYSIGGSISGSHATGTVTSSGDYAGGFAGYSSNATLSNDYATGTVTGVEETAGGTTYDPSDVGGFAGYASGDTVTNAYATGDVTTTGSLVGGFVGESQCQSDYENSYATGSVTGVSSVGGFVGDDNCSGNTASKFGQTYATHGLVTATGQYAGGFAGSLSDSTIKDAFASDLVYGHSDVGGFAGSVTNQSQISNVYSRGSVITKDTSTTGGLIGVADQSSQILNSFWDIPRSLFTTSAGGMGESTSMMQTQSTFDNDTAKWDFTGTWSMNASDNQGYPFFQSNPIGVISQPILTTVNSISARTTIANARYYFRASEACTPIVTQPVASLPGNVEIHMSDLTTDTSPTQNENSYMEGLQVGGIYSYSFWCHDADENLSNAITVGPFTVIATPTQNSGGGVTVLIPTGTNLSGPTGQIITPAAVTPSTQSVITTNNSPSSSGGQNTVSFTFTHDLTVGKTDSDVAKLQQFLIDAGFPPAKTGLGSQGNTSTYFGTKTHTALAKYQKANGITPALGYFGPKTRAFVNGVLAKNK